jgi:hypothetical protein
MAKNKNYPSQQLMSPENYIRQKARNLPIYECWINKNWKEIMLGHIFVVRKHTNEKVTAGMFLTDLGCLGVKDTHYLFNVSESELREQIASSGDFFEMELIDYELAHNIIYAALEYAEEFGFKPHKDFTSITRFILEEDTDDIELIEIECGQNGKPIFVRTEESEVRAIQILNQLEQKVGNNYEIIDYDEDDPFSDKSYLEKRELFVSLMGKDLDDFTQEEQEHAKILTDSLLVDICDEDEIDVLFARWNAETTMTVSDEKYTSEFLGMEPERIITQKEQVAFDELLDLIYEKSGKAEKQMNQLKEKWGNIPFLCYCELIYLEEKDKKRQEVKLQEFLALYPNYSLLKLMQYALSGSHSTGQNTMALIDFDDIFEGRKSVSNFEMFEFQSKKIFGILTRNNLTETEAMYWMIDDVKLNEKQCQYIKAFLLLSRISMLKKYFELNN